MDLQLICPGDPVPPGHIACGECGRENVSRTAGTRNGVHRHYMPGTRDWCYGPTVTAKRREGQAAQ